jgi:hypothetical protein
MMITYLAVLIHAINQVFYQYLILLEKNCISEDISEELLNNLNG